MKRHLLLASAAMLGLAAPVAALAQANATVGLEEVVVTAQKRAVNLLLQREFTVQGCPPACCRPRLSGSLRRGLSP